MKRIATGLLCTLSIAAAATGCGTGTGSNGKSPAVHQNQQVDVFYAGSLTKWMSDRAAPDFQRAKGIVVNGKGQGSQGLAQQIHSGLATPDVFISASPRVDKQILMQPGHADIAGYFTLATDQMVIAYSRQSPFAKQLSAARNGQTPWWQVLELPGFRLGRTDPATDPKGVNTLLMLELAQQQTGQSDLLARVTHGNSENQVFPEETLLARLTSGQLDAVVAYRHEAVEWGMPYISLPAKVNLGDPKLTGVYHRATVQLGNGKQATGAPIVFTVALLKHAPHPQAGVQFIRWLLSAEGRQELAAQGLSPAATQFTGDRAALPASLQSVLSSPSS